MIWCLGDTFAQLLALFWTAQSSDKWWLGALHIVFVQIVWSICPNLTMYLFNFRCWDVEQLSHLTNDGCWVLFCPQGVPLGKEERRPLHCPYCQQLIIKCIFLIAQWICPNCTMYLFNLRRISLYCGVFFIKKRYFCSMIQLKVEIK